MQLVFSEAFLECSWQLQHSDDFGRDKKGFRYWLRWGFSENLVVFVGAVSPALLREEMTDREERLRHAFGSPSLPCWPEKMVSTSTVLAKSTFWMNGSHGR